MGITKEKRKLWFLFLVLPQLPQLPIWSVPASGASGASLDNDTFTLTCHQWVLGVRC
ncbi:MAG: hypothetical protein F6K31_07105 [Symploca sp. SIO2G7]|nr:hypothetical protein [Symploca sp. SIO2G7]